jgi:hypothetical protein
MGRGAGSKLAGDIQGKRELERRIREDKGTPIKVADHELREIENGVKDIRGRNGCN